jgi:hypothetical protein
MNNSEAAGKEVATEELTWSEWKKKVDTIVPPDWNSDNRRLQVPNLHLNE